MSATRVMIVDDYPPNVELVSFVLEEAGFVVESVGDAALAVSRIAAFGPQLILMDIQLPGMDGLALTRMLKADPATDHIVIVAFTAYAMKGDEATMLAAGCDGYIPKPIDVAKLAGSIRELLAARRPGPAG